MNIRAEEILVSANGRTVFGKVWTAGEAGRRPVVILSHGYNGCHSDFDVECRAFAEKGFAACSIDFCGGSTRSRSSGSSTEMTIFTEKEDLLAVYDYLAAQQTTDPERMYLLAGSQGGLVTAMAAEERADTLAGMVLYFPALSIPDNWRDRFKGPEGIPETMDFWNLTLGRGFFASMRDYSPYEHIGGFSGPVVLLHGDQDGVIPLSVSQRAQSIYPNAQLYVMPGEGHGFSPEGVRFAIDKALKMMVG